MSLREVSLNDKYELATGVVYMTGNQALVRLAMLQADRDRAAGLNTAGYITGYRGSPIGTFDFELARANRYLQARGIVAQTGVNEDLAATAVWGTQMVESDPERNYDGVFALWYGKGPGVFRSGDVLKHGSYYGASKHGGVLLVPGDDPIARSSTIANASDADLIAHGCPLLYPSTIQEIIDYGLLGWAMSRYSGAWVSLKLVNETIEGTSTVNIDPLRSSPVVPKDMIVPAEAHFIPPVASLAGQTAERMANGERIALVQAYARSNRMDKTVYCPAERRLGIVCAGKPFQDVRKALQLLGIDRAAAEAAGISLYKIAMPWPLDATSFIEFAKGHEEILVVEEKQPLIERQITNILYNAPTADRPRVVGKRDELGQSLQQTWGGVDPLTLMEVIAARLERNGIAPSTMSRNLQRVRSQLAASRPDATQEVRRSAWYCPGCPHSTSTRVPDGERALGGIGCHTMGVFMNRATWPTQMGGEGHTWVGMSHFVRSKHRFQNLGDGTYTHSGIQAVHAAVVQGVNLTYKILFNSAVAMTGGQTPEGSLTVQKISHQLASLGVGRIAITTDDVSKYSGSPPFAPGTTIHHRGELEHLQREFRELKGVTAIIHDQECAAEKRRKRKRGLLESPRKRMFINKAVCEACGDCSVQSNCMSIQTVATVFGNKRVVDQSTCNLDYSCAEGFCPSFVTVYGGNIRKAKNVSLSDSLFADLPTPEVPSPTGTYSVLINGIGGTGVVTVGAILGMASHLEGKAAAIFDNTGFAQKGGAVQSHVRIARHQDDISALPIGVGEADLLLGCDLVVSATRESMQTVTAAKTRAVVNSHAVPTAELQKSRDFVVPAAKLLKKMRGVLGEQMKVLDSTAIATAFLGDSIASNMMLIGYAYQQGWLPLSAQSIMRAIELNEQAVEFNHRAFTLGRVAAAHPAELEKLIANNRPKVTNEAVTEIDADARARRVAYLVAYQDASYARHYRDFVEEVARIEAGKIANRTAFSRAVMDNYFRLLAYKDEYEVARLYSDDNLRNELHGQFEGDFRVTVHLAPPILAKRNPVTGRAEKREFGPWIFPVFRVLAALKFVRGTIFDLFGYQRERRMERQLIVEYRETIMSLLNALNEGNYEIACKIAELPADIRGFGHIKEKAMAEAATRQRSLMETFRQTPETLLPTKAEAKHLTRELAS